MKDLHLDPEEATYLDLGNDIVFWSKESIPWARTKRIPCLINEHLLLDQGHRMCLHHGEHPELHLERG